MAVTVGNNALLLTPSAGGECVHTEGGRSALIQDVVKKKKEKKSPLPVCLSAWQPQGHCGAQCGPLMANNQ